MLTSCDIRGISVSTGKLRIHDVLEKTVDITKVESFILKYSLLNIYQKFPIKSYSTYDDNAQEKIRIKFERKWREDKTVLMSYEEQLAYQCLYVCNIGNYSIYAAWLSDRKDNLQLQFVGDKAFVINVNSTKRLSSFDLMHEIGRLLDNV